MKKITVLLADDHTVVREGFLALLNAEPDMNVLGEAQTGRQAVELAKKLCPAVVVMDIAMPVLNGLEAARQIMKAVPTTKVIILSAHNDEVYIEKVASLGLAGYLIKQSSAKHLSKAIREVQKGNTFVGPHSQASCDQRMQLRKEIAPLTSREMEVLQLIAEGRANKQVASELKISIKTVEKHRQSLMEKLNIHDTAGLTRYAINAGIIESNVQVTIL